MHIYLPSELVLKARLFRGLSAPSRRALIEAVRDGEHSVAHLVAALGLSHPTVSARLRPGGEAPGGSRYAFAAPADGQVETLLRLAQLGVCPRYRQEG